MKINLSFGEQVVSAWGERYRTVAMTNYGNMWVLTYWDAPLPDDPHRTLRYWKEIKPDGSEETQR